VLKFFRNFKVLFIAFVLFKRLQKPSIWSQRKTALYICNWLKEFYNQVHGFNWGRFSITEFSSPPLLINVTLSII